MQKIHSAKNTLMSGSKPLASLLIRMTPISAQWRITINTSSPTSYILNWCTFQETNAKNTKQINAEKYKDITTTKTVPCLWCCPEQESCELCNIWSKFKFDNFWPIFYDFNDNVWQFENWNFCTFFLNLIFFENFEKKIMIFETCWKKLNNVL